MRKTAKSKRRVSKPRRSRSKNSSFTFQRLVIFTTCLLLVLGVFSLKKNSITQSVAGISVMKGLFSQVEVAWDPIDGATSYNLYYKQKDDQEFTNSVRNIPADITQYLISYLVKGKEYEYKLAAVGSNGQEFFWTVAYELSEPESM